MKFTRLVSVTNFVVASSALGFQVFVLYPWHTQLDHGFEELKKEHLKVLESVRGKISNEEQQGLKDRIEKLGQNRWRWF
ncbi:hypothetical protein QBC33DRAFT_547630 [Phialemonium atrogriseum]|uniref:Mitochondrial phosphate carrier protein n=1 Tax=Phialemonium atrogriseum TaxID=1093897 RepID=A0AAJ0FID4_9PEZI|nr:uncharacterized protein QBC33DRAFT_547630 [Phialemonium atrogriseum]KAK1764263.1 hypothetical protein QBC33DRAFT_547630 [Phialemonium atrogriseum]